VNYNTGVSHRWGDPATARWTSFVSASGNLGLNRCTVTYTNPNGAASAAFLRGQMRGWQSVAFTPAPGWYWHFPTPGFVHFATTIPTRTSDDWFLSLPYWLVTLLAAVLPGFRIVRTWLHRRRALPGHCRVCGYDVRATPGRCPECGTAVSV
jgi:hypothetical protein